MWVPAVHAVRDLKRPHVVFHVEQFAKPLRFPALPHTPPSARNAAPDLAQVVAKRVAHREREHRDGAFFPVLDRALQLVGPVRADALRADRAGPHRAAREHAADASRAVLAALQLHRRRDAAAAARALPWGSERSQLVSEPPLRNAPHVQRERLCPTCADFGAFCLAGALPRSMRPHGRMFNRAGPRFGSRARRCRHARRVPSRRRAAASRCAERGGVSSR